MPSIGQLAGFLPPRRCCSHGWAALRLAVFLSTAPSLLVAQNHLTGVVFQRQDAGFVPVAGARVEARLAPGAEVIATVDTDEFGRYLLDGLPAARIEITAAHPRYYPASRPDRGGEAAVRCADPGLCAQVDFEMLPTGELEVLVVDSLGVPVEDASVQVRRLDEPGRTLKPTLRTVRGVFRTSRMRPGRYKVEAEPVEGRGILYHRVAAELDFPYGQENETVRLVMPSERLYRVAGTILGLEEAVAPMLVVLEPWAEDAEETERRPRLGAPVEPSGHFAVNGVRRGSFSLKLIWGRDSQLDLANSPSRLLAKIQVEGDLTGLLFTAPPDVGWQQRDAAEQQPNQRERSPR